MAGAASLSMQSRLPPIEADLPEAAPSRPICVKHYGRRVLFAAVAVGLVVALLHVSGPSKDSKSAEYLQSPQNSEAAAPPPPPAPAAAALPPSPSSFPAGGGFWFILLANPFFFPALMAALGAVFYKVANYVYMKKIAPHLNLEPSLTITNLDPNFPIVMDYLSKRCLSSIAQRNIEAETFKEKITNSKKAMANRWFGISDEKSAPSRFLFRPGALKYASVAAKNTFRYTPYVPTTVDPKTGKVWDQSDPYADDAQREARDEENDNPRPLWARLIMLVWFYGASANPEIGLIVEESESANNQPGGAQKPTKWLTLSLKGTDTAILKQIVNDALLWHFETESKNSDLKIYVLSENRWVEDWTFAVSRKKRSKESVVFDDNDSGKNILRELLDDAQNFFSEQTVQTYADKGMPHRRGYLLYGPPGCGKTSFITVLAGELNKDVCILNLNDNMSDNGLASALRNAPMSAIIALEDVDAIFVSLDKDGQKTKDKRQMKSAGLSFSGLLNALDGVASQEGRILVMTTNHREKLDPALIRPGRVDVEKEIRNASRKQIEGMFLRFYGTQPYPEALVSLARNFAAKLPDYEISMAKLQGFFQAAAKRITNSSGETVGFHVAPEQCIDKAAELMTHGDEDPSMSVFEHFWRVGLERYAAHFERQCVCNIAHFRSCDIDSVAKTCIELELDAAAVGLLKKLQKEDEELMSSSYAEADSSTIRDLFFAAYPSTDSNGNVAVYSKFNPLTRTRSARNRCKGSDGQTDSPCGDETPSSGASCVPGDSRSLLEVCTSVQGLIKSSASQKNTPLLFHASIYRIKQLFQFYHSSPYACEAMLKNFAFKPATICQFSSRQSCERVAQDLQLPAFLKRLSLPPAMIPVLDDMLIFDVKSFMEFCSSSSAHVICARFYLQVEQARRLIDFCSKDEKKNVQCRRMFSLPSKPETRAFFTSHYTSSLADVDEAAIEKIENHALNFAERLCDSVRKCTSAVSYFEIADFLADKAPDSAVGRDALDGLISPTVLARTTNPICHVFEHLLRVGLQHYAPAFVRCGSTSVAQFRNIDIESVAEAFPLLALDEDAQKQLKLIQKEDEKYILDHFASASRLQVKNVLRGTGASEAVVSRIMSQNISLYLLRTIASAVPSLELESKMFDESISALFSPYTANELQQQPLSFMIFIRRLNLALEDFEYFSDRFESVSRFVKDIREGNVKEKDVSFAGPDSPLAAFCSSKPAINSVARYKFQYPPTSDVAQAFIFFFTQSGSSLLLQDMKHHAFCFSRILSGYNSAGNMFPFRGRAYFSRCEIDAFLEAKFKTFAENKEESVISTTVELCHSLFQFRQSASFLQEPAPPQPPPIQKTDLALWLEGVFAGSPHTADDVCAKLRELALCRMADFDVVLEKDLHMGVLQGDAKLKFADACKLLAAFKTLKAEQKK